MGKTDQRRPTRRRRVLGAALAALASGGLPLVASGPASANAAGTAVVISRVYGGGGNSGAPYTNDFVELFNPTAATVSLAGYSVQYASATGTGNFAATALSGSIAPGRYYLVQMSGGANGVALPTADATGTTAMSATGGKVILANSHRVARSAGRRLRWARPRST